MRLKLKSNLDKTVYNFTNISDIDDSKLFYHFNLQLEEGMPDGSYTYYLFDDNDKQVANGVLQIGDYESKQSVTAYTKNNEYKQYNG